MKETLKPGIETTHTFTVPESKTVAHLYPEAEEFKVMPDVFATGFLVGLIEWTCIKAVNPHLDWPAEQTVGIHVDAAHMAATPPGLTITSTVKLIKVEGKKLFFEFQAHDGVDLITKGTHQRFVINKKKFDENLKGKK